MVFFFSRSSFLQTITGVFFFSFPGSFSFSHQAGPLVRAVNPISKQKRRKHCGCHGPGCVPVQFHIFTYGGGLGGEDKGVFLLPRHAPEEPLFSLRQNVESQARRVKTKQNQAAPGRARSPKTPRLHLHHRIANLQRRLLSPSRGPTEGRRKAVCQANAPNLVPRFQGNYRVAAWLSGSLVSDGGLRRSEQALETPWALQIDEHLFLTFWS